MAESMKGQENGTIGQGRYFGPATRPDYDTANWAVTLASAREMVEHPEPGKRRKTPGSPAFLRGSADTGYDGALLSIYHSIPLAREALTFSPLKIYDYGHNSEWWSGTTDENAKSLSMEQSTAGAEDRRRYLAEIQCLMAFLDNTSRAYGSVDALNDLRYSRHFQPENGLTKFLEAWKQAAMQEQPDEPLTQIFTTKAVQAPEILGVDPEEKALFLIEGPVRKALTQAEMLDKIVWSDAPTAPLQDVWFEDMGHVVTMRCFNDEPEATKLDILVSEIWYLDRYTPALKQTLRELRQRCLHLLREKELLTHATNRLTETPKRPNAASKNINRVLNNAKQAISIALDEEEMSSSNTFSDVATLHSQIDTILEHITTHISDLDRRQIALEQQVRTIMSDITDPATSTQQLRHKYQLQGVATKSNIMYIRQLNQDLIGMDDNEDETHDTYQWWRMAWEQNNPLQEQETPYSVRKVYFRDVVEAVRNEHHTAVLVYADEIAMTFAKSPLSPALQYFIEQDNRAFEDEISLNQVSSARRSRTWSNDTNSTTVMDENDPFDDQMSFSRRRDGTPMSTSTSPSDDEGPSPKRPRSSDESLQTQTESMMPPAYEDVVTDYQHEPQRPGNKIGFYAEQLLHQVDENAKKVVDVVFEAAPSSIGFMSLHGMIEHHWLADGLQRPACSLFDVSSDHRMSGPYG